MKRFNTFILSLLCLVMLACGTQDKEQQQTVPLIEATDLITQSSEVVTEHSTFEQATGMFEKLFKQEVEENFGLVPLEEETIVDLNAFFPAQLLSYTQTLETSFNSAESRIHLFTTSYEKKDEAVLFTVYQFESSLKILEFFMAIDSIYKIDPGLKIHEISINGFDGWEVLNKEGKRLEVCLVLPETRLIQGSAGTIFHGDIKNMLSALKLKNL